MRKQAFTYWSTQIHSLEKSLAIYLSNSPHMETNFRRMMEAKSHFSIEDQLYHQLHFLFLEQLCNKRTFMRC